MDCFIAMCYQGLNGTISRWYFGLWFQINLLAPINLSFFLMIKSFVIGNWKLNGNSAFIGNFVDELEQNTLSRRQCSIGLCVPFVYISQLVQSLQEMPIAVGAQDVSMHQQGTFTGEVSAEMLVDVGCKYVIIGHSERKQHHQEKDINVLAKANQVAEQGLMPICCVGESLQERDSGLVDQIIERQIAVLLEADGGKLKNMIIAYEPIWAIGTGLTATPEQAEEVHQFIRSLLYRHSEYLAESTPILYGGSVNEENALALSTMSNINGFLVGGASLKAHSFMKICEVY